MMRCRAHGAAGDKRPRATAEALWKDRQRLA